MEIVSNNTERRWSFCLVSLVWRHWEWDGSDTIWTRALQSTYPAHAMHCPLSILHGHMMYTPHPVCMGVGIRTCGLTIKWLDKLDQIIRNGWKRSKSKLVSQLSGTRKLIKSLSKVFAMFRSHNIQNHEIWKLFFADRQTDRQPITLPLAHAYRVTSWLVGHVL